MASPAAGADIEELQTTKSEKLLAVVLAVFLLIGGVWSYQELDDEVRDRIEIGSGSAADRAAVQRRTLAQGRVFVAQARVARTRNELELRRERYRTALDAGRPARALERAYLASEADHAQARRELVAARRALAAAQPAAAEASRRIAAEARSRRDRQELVVFALRLLLVVVTLLVSYWLLAWLRRRNSRWLALAGSGVAVGTILAFTLAVDYLTDYAEPLELGVLLLSLIGAAATLVAFFLLQRYLVGRLPQRRVRKRQCPFCGFALGAGDHCEGCGRRVIAPCESCGAARRIGARHCAACGAA